ncbi:hypothetical protein [Halomicrococcus sp. NG-SE-24]|uniref:hypothetical protein n=1 Tax=Halomicrococcus sp. NG-SE-24 TaxID=3436928 RepID=UPI003D980384
MDIAERLRADDRLEPVSRTEVMQYWLANEVEVESDAPDPDDLPTEPGLREELVDRKPIAARVFGAEEAEWYLTELSVDELRDLQVVVGPESEGWRAFADDGRIGAVAKRIIEADDATEFDAKAEEDFEEVASLADDIEASGTNGRLVVVEEGDDPAYVADGNHRAVAQVLSLLRDEAKNGETDEKREVYFGVRPGATARS